MAQLNVRIFFRSFRYAIHGLRYALRHEQSFRVQVVIACIVVVLMCVIRITIIEALILILTISSVLVLELLNTVLETFLDILKPRMHPFVGTIKDVMAAAVFLASVTALIIGCCIFLPYFLRAG